MDVNYSFASCCVFGIGLPQAAAPWLLSYVVRKRQASTTATGRQVEFVAHREPAELGQLIASEIASRFPPSGISDDPEILPGGVIHQLTGIYCPGCGGLRAVFDLTRGELLSALRNNALLVLIPVWLALGFLASSHRLLGRPFLAGHHRLLTRLAIASIAVVTVFRTDTSQNARSRHPRLTSPLNPAG